MALGVRPYSLEAHGHAVWEPIAPFDSVPYNLFACGIRAIRVARGLTMDELSALLELLLLDPVRDLPPEDDLVSAFWERAIEHVTCEAVDALAEGDASEREAFYGQADEVELMAAEAAQRSSALEAKAMAVTTDRSAFAQPSRGRSPMRLDDVVRSVFASQLDVSSDKWSERYVDALVEGYLDAASNRDAPLVLASLRKSAADLVVAGRLKLVVSMHDALVARLAHRVKGEDYQRLSAALTNALFGAETLELSLKRLEEEPDEVPLFEPVLKALWAAELPTALAVLAAAPPGRSAKRSRASSSGSSRGTSSMWRSRSPEWTRTSPADSSRSSGVRGHPKPSAPWRSSRRATTRRCGSRHRCSSRRRPTRFRGSSCSSSRATRRWRGWRRSAR